MAQAGHGRPQNNREAVRWFTLAAEQGNSTSQHRLGLMYYYGNGVKKNYKTALKWNTLAAEQFYLQAVTMMGMFYVAGQGVVVDNERGYMWFIIGQMVGNKLAGEHKNMFASEMTSTQRSNSMDMALACIASDLVDC